MQLLFTEAILSSSPRTVLPYSIDCAEPPSPVPPGVPSSLGAAQDRDGAGSSSNACSFTRQAFQSAARVWDGSLIPQNKPMDYSWGQREFQR